MSSTVSIDNVADVAAILSVGMRGSCDHHVVRVRNIFLDVETSITDVVLEARGLETFNQSRVGEVVEIFDVVDHL